MKQHLKIIDNFFDKKFLSDLSFMIEHKIPFTPNNIANSKSWPYGEIGSHRLFGTCIFLRNNLNRFKILNEHADKFFDIFEAIENNILKRKVYLTRIDINLQHTNCDGSGHRDGPENDTTIMLMSNSYWESTWGGQFQILSDDGNSVVEECEYVPGRILIFPSHLLHRGLGPTKKYVYRHTVTFRVPEEHWYIDQSYQQMILN